MSLTYSLNGYVLENRTQVSGIWLLQGTEYAPGLSPRNATVEVPRRHYEIPNWISPMSAITVTLALRLKYDTDTDLRDGWNLLTGLLGTGSNNPVLMERIRGDQVEQADAQLASTSAPDFTCNQNRADVQIIMSIPGGAWRGDEIDQTFSAGTNQAVGAAEMSSLPITDMLLRVPGPLTTLGVTDVISGTGIAWGGGTVTVASGQWLLISPSVMRAVIVDTDTWNLDDGDPASGTLVFTGMGPLAITSRRQGPDGDPISGITVTMGGGSGPLTVRARTAVA
ncbi:MAG: hypothetical protein IJI97_07860 [Clostridia bacterium]|nr:hypothetical protein [Clostridia bacterium]